MSETAELIGYVIMCFVCTIAVFVNKNLYTNIKNEEHLDKGKTIQHIIKVYALVQCIGWPPIVSCYGLIFFSTVVLGIVETSTAKYLILCFRFSHSLLRDYVSFHSLIVAICRYTFCVLSSWSERVGILRLRYWIVRCSIGVPLLLTLLYDATYPLERFFSDHFIDNPTVQMSNNNSINFKDNLNINIHESPVYHLTNEFLPKYLIYGLNGLRVLIFVIIYSNFIEGCLYTHACIVLLR